MWILTERIRTILLVRKEKEISNKENDRDTFDPKSTTKHLEYNNVSMYVFVAYMAKSNEETFQNEYIYRGQSFISLKKGKR